MATAPFQPLPPPPTRPVFMDEVGRWPPGLRRRWGDLSMTCIQDFSLPELEARLMAYTRIKADPGRYLTVRLRQALVDFECGGAA